VATRRIIRSKVFLYVRMLKLEISNVFKLHVVIFISRCHFLSRAEFLRQKILFVGIVLQCEKKLTP
jgi:hypothetical protein